jgi:hypothetical protein
MMRQFREHFVGGGLLVGCLVGVGTALLGARTDWLDLVLTIVISAATFAGVMTLATELVCRTFRRSGGATGLLFGSAIVASLLGGMAILRAAEQIPHGRWQRLPDLPIPARVFAGPPCHRLVGSDDRVVVLATVSGRYLVRHRGSAGGQWAEESAIPDSIAERGERCQPMFLESATPTLQGRVVESFRIDDDGVDCDGRRHYRLLADGSVWEWSTGGCAMMWLMGHLTFSIVLLVVGVTAARRRLGSGVTDWAFPLVSDAAA